MTKSLKTLFLLCTVIQHFFHKEKKLSPSFTPKLLKVLEGKQIAKSTMEIKKTSWKEKSWHC